MFERDVRLLQIELDNCKAVRSAKQPHTPLLNVVDIFVEEAQLVLGSNSKDSAVKFDKLVNRLAADLREQCAIILDGSFSTKVATVEYARMLVEAALGKLRRSLGVECPPDHNEALLFSGQTSSSLHSWNSLTLNVFATRMERDRIRSAAAVVDQQARRTVVCLREVAEQLAASGTVPQHHAALLLRLEKCQMVCEALSSLASGQTEMFTPSSSLAGQFGGPPGQAAGSGGAVVHFAQLPSERLGSPHSHAPPSSAATPLASLRASGDEGGGSTAGGVRTVHLSLQDAMKVIRSSDATRPSPRVSGMVHRGHFSQYNADGRRKVNTAGLSSIAQAPVVASPAAKRNAR
jgi:hypothetical protein